MIQLKSSPWCIVALLIGAFVQFGNSAPQFLDTFEVKKAANATYTYQSLNGLQNGYSYVYGDSYATGYKSEFPPKCFDARKSNKTVRA